MTVPKTSETQRTALWYTQSRAVSYACRCWKARQMLPQTSDSCACKHEVRDHSSPCHLSSRVVSSSDSAILLCTLYCILVFSNGIVLIYQSSDGHLAVYVSMEESTTCIA